MVIWAAIIAVVISGSSPQTVVFQSKDFFQTEYECFSSLQKEGNELLSVLEELGVDYSIEGLCVPLDNQGKA